MAKPCNSDTAVQSENERYVKYYELQACLKDAFEKFSTDINKKLEEISNNTKGLVTYTHHDERIKLAHKHHSEQLVHLQRIHDTLDKR